MTEPWPFPAASVRYIYADNVIEHLTLEQSRSALRFAFVSLVPGGIIRLATPDVERTARAYLEGGELARQHLQRHVDKGHDAHYPVDLLRLTFTMYGHHRGYLFDEASLTEELHRAGFVGVTRCEAGRSSEAGLRGLETRAAPTEAATALIIEAAKPTSP